MSGYLVVQLGEDATVDSKVTDRKMGAALIPAGVTTITGAHIVTTTKSDPCEQLRKNIRFLLKMIAGQSTNCAGPNCGAEIWFIKHPRTGTIMPITADAINHHADCPDAKDKPWKKGEDGNES